MKSKYITIVTGASKGIGKAIALELASPNTLLVCISKQDQLGLMDTITTIKGMGFEAYPILCDLSDYQAVSAAFQEIQELGLPLQRVINNAGVSQIKLFTDTKPEDWQYIISNNLTSVYNVCHHVVPEMIKNQEGQILNISSIWGNDGASMEVAYSASKGGLNAFTKALAKELGPSHISVNALACGLIDTSMNNFLSDEEITNLKDAISFGRSGTVQEVAIFVRSILDTATYLNGQIITYDGGMY